MFFIENIDRILELVRTVVRAAGDVVRGKIQTAADKIETALGMTIPLILSFLARLLGLSGIAEKVRSVIARFKSKVEKAVTKFLRKLVAKFKSGVAKGVKAAKKLGAAILKKFFPKTRFKAGGVSHTISARLEGQRPVAVISSQTQHLSAFLDWLEGRPVSEIPGDPAKAKAIQAQTLKNMPKARKLLASIDATLARMDTLRGQPDPEPALRKEEKGLQGQQTKLAAVISSMVGSSSGKATQPLPQIVKYKLEGMAANYSSLPQGLKDNIDRDHEPQTALLVHVASLRLFRDRGIQKSVEGGGAPGGLAINLHNRRHRLGRTWGDDGKVEVKTAKKKVDRIAGKDETPDRRRDQIVGVLQTEAGKDAEQVEEGVLSKRAENKTAWGDIWSIGTKKKATGLSTDSQKMHEQKLEVVKDVKSQIRTGLGRVRSQDFDRYKEKK
jgi:hypothetical protein